MTNKNTKKMSIKTKAGKIAFIAHKSIGFLKMTSIVQHIIGMAFPKFETAEDLSIKDYMPSLQVLALRYAVLEAYTDIFSKVTIVDGEHINEIGYEVIMDTNAYEKVAAFAKAEVAKLSEFAWDAIDTYREYMIHSKDINATFDAIVSKFDKFTAIFGDMSKLDMDKLLGAAGKLMGMDNDKLVETVLKFQREADQGV